MKNQRLNNKFNHKSPPFSVTGLCVYSYPEMELVNGVPFDNLSQFKKMLNIDNRTVYKYLDTYTPYNGYIFLSADILETFSRVPCPKAGLNNIKGTELIQEDKKTNVISFYNNS